MGYVIGLDAGHYVGDGRVARAYRSSLGTSDEYALNLKTYNAVSAELKRNGFSVVDIGRQLSSVVERAKNAKKTKCNAVVSLHHNAGGGTGITLFRHSNGVMGDKSLALQNDLYKYLKQVNAGNRATPVTTKELGVINCNNTGCPATLIECAFMDNKADVALIKDSTYNQKLAVAIAKGLCDYFGVAYREVSQSTTPSIPTSKVYNPWAYARVTNLTNLDPRLNVRSGPSTDHGVIRQLANGNEVDVLEVYTNGWAKINIVGTIGYVNAHYLNITERVEVGVRTATVVNCTALNIRKTPNGSVIATIHKGDTVEIIGAGKDSDGDSWTKIRKDKTEGYVWPKYLD